jgi:hypothetical protein
MGDLLHPVDVLVLRPNGHSSLLDALFVSRRSQRVVYAATTRGPETSLWRVASNGSLTQVAQIEWDHQMHSGTAGDGSLKRTHSSSEMLTFNGKMLKTEEFLRKGRGWFPTEYVSCFSSEFYEEGVRFEICGSLDVLIHLAPDC